MNDLNNIFKQLEQLSLFELSRLRSAITKTLDDPERNEAIKRHIKVGMKITYYSSRTNNLIEATIVDIRNTRVSVINSSDGEKWNIKLYSINLNDVDIDIAPKKTSGHLDRNSLKVGDKVGFMSDKGGHEVYGVVTKLNPKTARVTLTTGDKWVVYYPSLFLITEGYSSSSDGQLLIEGEVVT